MTHIWYIDESGLTAAFINKTMNLSIQVYTKIREATKFFWDRLKLDKQLPTTGRPLKIKPVEAIAAGLFKQRQNIETKKAAWEILSPAASYKTFVVAVNRCAKWAGVILALILRVNRVHAHVVKHTDSTDVPVCLIKNAARHKTMSCLASWGKTGKGWFYGLKLHMTTDLKRKTLAIRFTSGNAHDTSVTVNMNKGIYGLFVADAGYVGERLAREFYEEHKRILFAAPRKNMRKMITAWQYALYNTRMRIELNFRALKQFYGLITSMPRSVNGYLSHYLYALCAYVIA